MEKKKITVIRPATETLDIFLPFYFVTEHDTSRYPAVVFAIKNALKTLAVILPVRRAVHSSERCSHLM